MRIPSIYDLPEDIEAETLARLGAVKTTYIEDMGLSPTQADVAIKMWLTMNEIVQSSTAPLTIQTLAKAQSIQSHHETTFGEARPHR